MLESRQELKTQGMSRQLNSVSKVSYYRHNSRWEHIKPPLGWREQSFFLVTEISKNKQTNKQKTKTKKKRKKKTQKTKQNKNQPGYGASNDSLITGFFMCIATLNIDS